ncbi:helix-turn-helix domain-containing protein [Caproiciproducens sp.]|uniref:helix-turn-helix domain-containing protein n=1 Tax=Caproiciproducens sp. TaxID=1954376 RepID=UPI00289E6086|nr:helix-turn-helix transcriptional regulator [Caproiciproducens sp.]
MYEIFEQLLKKYGVTPYRVHKETGVPQSTLSDWKNGKGVPKVDKLKAIADYFGVTVDYLLGNEQKETLALTKKDERDIKNKIDEIIDMMANQQGLMFDGDPLTPEALQSIRSAMELGMAAATIKNKEKYNPRKNKKE